MRHGPSEDTQILGASVQKNLVVMATWHPGFVLPWATYCTRVLLQIVNYRTEFTGVAEIYLTVVLLCRSVLLWGM
jgi:hypothetical protein